MNREQLYAQIKAKKSMLCVGLDVDFDKMPEHVKALAKGGEVVVNITDKVITFDNHGAKSYLYTGGTVMQYEPTEAFNNATKTPNEAVGVVNNAPAIRNVRGAPNNNTAGANLKNEVNKAVSKSTSTPSKTTSSASTTQPKKTTSTSSSNKGIASFSQGMMVK